jgi:hypothetical protein
MLKHPLECIVTLMSSDIIHPLFLNLNLQWLVTKNTQRKLVLGTYFFGYEPSCANIFYIYLDFMCPYIFSFYNLRQDYLCKIQKVV